MDTKLLIVEDELLIAEILSRKLKKLGYTVVDIVSSGELAIERARETEPDLILMDIVIEGDMDGIETAAKIHENQNIPIIYTTAYADDDTLDRAENTGSYGYILKPFKERELHACIKIALSQHQQSLKMQQSLAEAQANSANKSRYISMASHDLRTPLTTIQLSAEILQNNNNHPAHSGEEFQKKSFERIKRAVNNMSQMLDDVLMLNKAESGQLPFFPDFLNVVELCASLLEDLQPIAAGKHCLKLQIHGESIPGYLDKKLLRHILMNLLSNAIKYSPKGGDVILDLTWEPQQLIFRIQDEGIGIPPDFQSQLFQQFQRASNVGNIKGTGLGLTIVKHSVDVHGGTIRVESSLGKGTIFIVTLPNLMPPPKWTYEESSNF